MPACIGGAILAGGLVSSVVGGITQSNATDSANAANAANVASANAAQSSDVAATNQANWDAYLLSRGLYAPNAATGTIPTGATAENTKLPLYANIDIASGPGTPASPVTWVKKGTAPAAPTYATPKWSLTAAPAG